MNKECSLNLAIGKPVDKPGDVKATRIATFTRFILPFAYQLEKSAGKNPSLYYQVNPASDLSFVKRRKYFTRETGHILYDRACWLDMCPAWEDTMWGKGEVEVTLRGQRFFLGMLPPRITLFEAGTDRDGGLLPPSGVSEGVKPTQTGFLQVDVYFPQKEDQAPELDDLLLLNEFFRYFHLPREEHEKIFKSNFGRIPAGYPGGKPVGELGQLECYFERWANLLELPVIHGDVQYRLFPRSWSDAARAWCYNSDDGREHWQIYADNRTYVWTVVFLDRGGATLQACFSPRSEQDRCLQAHRFGHWIRLLNVDAPEFDARKNRYKSARHTNDRITAFEQRWARERTYGRWQEAGTWYGFCYHGSAVLSPAGEYRVFSPARSYYSDTLLLLFYVRLSLFRFSRTLSEIVEDPKERSQQLREKLLPLRKIFARFTILYRYPLVSNQQQMLEMYELMRGALDIEPLFREVQQEIESTHEFLEAVEASRLSRVANMLAGLGLPMAAGGLTAALFSMEDNNIWAWLRSATGYHLNGDLVVQALLVVLVTVAVALFVHWKSRRNDGGNG